jgi:hypothetical protein
MKPESALATVLEKLEEAGIAYMITGSYAGSVATVLRLCPPNWGVFDLTLSSPVV